MERINDKTTGTRMFDGYLGVVSTTFVYRVLLCLFLFALGNPVCAQSNEGNVEIPLEKIGDDLISADNQNPASDSLSIPFDQLYKVSLTDDFIRRSEVKKRYYPELIFDKNITENAVNSVTQYYTLINAPYDSLYSCEVWEQEYEQRLSTTYPQDELDKLNNEHKEKFTCDSDIVSVRRGDFWNEIFAINKEYANPNGFADIERSIKEVHDRLGLDWDDTIFVAKDAIEKHRAAVKHVFTNLKSEINKRYIK